MASTDCGTFDGTECWSVNDCVGKAYMLSPSPIPPGNYFKIYVGTPAAYAEKWLYSGDRTDRFDF